MAVTTSLFVKGLGKAVGERSIIQVFSQFGTVVDCQIARHRSGRSAGFAIVTFDSVAAAQRALQAADNAVLFGRQVSVRWYSAERNEVAGTTTGPVLARMSNGSGSVGQDPSFAPSMLTPAALLANQGNELLLQQLAAIGASDVQWTSPLPGDCSSGGAAEEQATASWRNMSAWVSSACTQEPSSGPLASSSVRRSFDGATPQPATRRRSTQGSGVSLSLDGLDLSQMRSASEASGSMGGAEDPGSFGKSRLVSKWGVSVGGDKGYSLGGCDPTSILSTSVGGALSETGTMNSAASVSSAGSSDDNLAAHMAALGLCEPNRSLLLSSASAGCASLLNTMSSSLEDSLTAPLSAPLPLLQSHGSMPSAAMQHLSSTSLMPTANAAGPRTAPTTPSKLPLGGHHAHNQHAGRGCQLLFQADAGGMGMHAPLQAHQAALKHAHLSVAQQQYASALAQLSAARSQILAAAAALQQHPCAMPYGSGMLSASMTGHAAAALDLSGLRPLPNNMHLY